ncbi:MAG: hypothetical protein AAF721_11010 [Myxococcota bacterium]
MTARHGLAWVLGLCIGCFAEPAGSSSSTGEECPAGEPSCACFGNSTCLEGLTCHPELQLCFSDDCVAGTQDCPCPPEGCNGTLVCEGNSCQEPQTNTDGGVTGTPTTSSDSGGAGASTASVLDDTGSDADSGTSTGGPIVCDDPSPFTELVIFGATETFNPTSPPAGDSLREALDGFCAQTNETACNGPAHALISLSEADSVASMPERYCLPDDVMVTDNISGVLASDFVSMLNPEMDLMQALADVFPEAVDTMYWTGSAANGTYAPTTNCRDWGTSGKIIDGDPGAIGSEQLTDSGWIRSGAAGCESSLAILCICGATSL